MHIRPRTHMHSLFLPSQVPGVIFSNFGVSRNFSGSLSILPSCSGESIPKALSSSFCDIMLTDALFSVNMNVCMYVYVCVCVQDSGESIPKALLSSFATSSLQMRCFLSYECVYVCVCVCVQDSEESIPKALSSSFATCSLLPCLCVVFCHMYVYVIVCSGESIPKALPSSFCDKILADALFSVICICVYVCVCEKERDSMQWEEHSESLVVVIWRQ
jgi:hypothetical protein